MKNKILKTITTFLLLLGCVIFGVTGCKACQNAQNDNNITETNKHASNGLKMANNNERISINMIFNSKYIDKIVIEEYEETEFRPNENGQIIIDFYPFQASRDYILDIYYKSDIAYLYSTNDFNILKNAFNYSNYDYFSIPSEYTLSYPYSKLTFEYYEEELENTTTTQNIFVTLNDNNIRYNLNYLTRKQLILNEKLEKPNFNCTLSTESYFMKYVYLTDNYIRATQLTINNSKFEFYDKIEDKYEDIYSYNTLDYLSSYDIYPRLIQFYPNFTKTNINFSGTYEEELEFVKYILDNSTLLTNEQIDVYQVGFNDGKGYGIEEATEWTNIIKLLAKSTEDILNIEILPNITIKILILVPIMFSILSFIVKIFVK